MIFTLGYAKQKLARFIDAGSTPDPDQIVERINEAIMNILMIEDWHLTVQRMRFFVSQDLLVLPYFAERIVAARPDVSMTDERGTGYGHVWSKYYEFLEGGPLQPKEEPTGLQDLIDLGDGHATMYDIDRASTSLLVAFSKAQADAGQVIHVRGSRPTQRELMSTSSNGTSFVINRWKDGVEGEIDYDNMQTSLMEVSDVSHLVKPVTADYVSLFAYNSSTHALSFLANYHPRETAPGFHRYRVQNADLQNGNAWTTLVKMRFVEATADTDPLLIQNIPAIKAMLLAIRENDLGNMTQKIAYTKDCMWLLGQQLKQNEPTENEFTIEDKYGFGSVEDI